MNLKILFTILMYYGVFSLIFLLGGSLFTDGYTAPQFNQTGNLTAEEGIGDAGLFGTGVDFGRFFTLIAFGIGLPDSLPSWFLVAFALWQSIITIMTVGFVISSIWNG